MSRRAGLLLLVAVPGLGPLGCKLEYAQQYSDDGGAADGGSDGSTSDGGTLDGGAPDGGVSDGGVSDGGVSDGGGPDGGSADGGEPDAEDCASVGDEDGNGLADCEDPACVDVCVEDCTGGVDEDRDGATDCEDDECYGIDGCPRPYIIRWNTDLDWEAQYWGSTLPARLGTDHAAMALSGSVSVTIEPDGWAGSVYTCPGRLQASSWDETTAVTLSYDSSYEAPSHNLYFYFDFAPTEGAGLEWNAACPIDVSWAAGRTSSLAFISPYPWDSASGAWVNLGEETWYYQYSSPDTRGGITRDSDGVVTYGYLYLQDPTAAYTLSWQGWY